MKIKRRFSIKGKEWRVEYVSGLRTDEGKKVSGYTNATERVIQIERSLETHHRLWVFWHEYKHARLWECGVVDNTGGLSDLAEEIVCDDFADFMTNDLGVTRDRNFKLVIRRKS